ncbi:apoptosis inhibitor 5 [Bacillus rossius redtenbacheri]|uniref:apoptosis inhibitor 5 n=1 Tax=Bacillus rossius redtenbacheri TaxID=93214 RepID=UPI002FDEB67D
MSTDRIEKLYKHFGVLADAKDKISEHEEDYLEILKAVKGSSKEKRLASQFIARFFKHFPQHANMAIEALFDLCEDEDVAIRKQAIKDLPSLCKDSKEYITRVADILAQLLQAEDTTELAVVNNSLMSLLGINPKGTLTGIFAQILDGEDYIRERCIKFLATKLKVLEPDVINKEMQDFIISETKKVIQDVTAEEFHQLMDLLAWTRLSHSVSGQQELVGIVAEQAELTREFDPAHDQDCVDKLIQCFSLALPYFSSQVDSSRFVSYMCDQVLPKLSLIVSPDEGSNPQLEILKLFAELCTHCGALEKSEEKLDKLYNKLIEYMPLPVDPESSEEPRLEFSIVECLMYAFHRLARHSPEVLTADEKKLKDFKMRLQFFARGTQGYIKKLREALQGKTDEELKTEENKIKAVALKTTSNINTLIKDLFHSPPSFKSVISLSWKPTIGAAKDGVMVGEKRHVPITFSDSPSKHAKSEKSHRELYQPPSGKYSTKVSGYMPYQRGGRGRGGRPRGGYRGNRTWRRGLY